MASAGQPLGDQVLSVVVVFYDMPREAPRTLFSLTPGYQRRAEDDDYEVIAIDNGSSSPLDPEMVRSFGRNFRYELFEPDAPSPAAALNRGIATARGDKVMTVIDGARILSPGIIRKTELAFRAFDNPFVFTLSMHLGDEVQNESVLTGYNQRVEDRLLDTVNWRSDGYELFRIASVGLSTAEGFFSPFTESNCVALRKEEFEQLGGYDERFRMPGGGLLNLDFFNRAHLAPTVEPVLLLGEATFHQFHGGVASNVPLAEHPFETFEREYREVVGAPYEAVERRPCYLGSIPSQCRLTPQTIHRDGVPSAAAALGRLRRLRARLRIADES